MCHSEIKVCDAKLGKLGIAKALAKHVCHSEALEGSGVLGARCGTGTWAGLAFSIKACNR